MITRAIALVLFVLLTSACHRSGRWEDDPKNFGRAFGGNKQPPEMEIVHSRYMRTPHFTYEYEYFFVIRAPKELIDSFVRSGEMKRYEGSQDLDIRLDQHFEEKPAWFIPKPLKHYDVWVFKAEPKQNFRAFIDKDTGEVHYTDFSM
jgi:hypothetical protein